MGQHDTLLVTINKVDVKYGKGESISKGARIEKIK
jgi:hypothetical protein